MKLKQTAILRTGKGKNKIMKEWMDEHTGGRTHEWMSI